MISAKKKKNAALVKCQVAAIENSTVWWLFDDCLVHDESLYLVAKQKQRTSSFWRVFLLFFHFRICIWIWWPISHKRALIFMVIFLLPCLRKCSLGFLVTRINLESYFSAYCQCITIYTKGTLQRFRVISNSVSYPKFQQKKNYIPFVMA